MVTKCGIVNRLTQHGLHILEPENNHPEPKLIEALVEVTMDTALCIELIKFA